MKIVKPPKGTKEQMQARRAWITALRSRKYKQHTASLASPSKQSHCCLGVLCEVVGVDYHHGNGTPPQSAWNALGMPKNGGIEGKHVDGSDRTFAQLCAGWNDSDALGFYQIARKLERRLLG